MGIIESLWPLNSDSENTVTKRVEKREEQTVEVNEYTVQFRDRTEDTYVGTVADIVPHHLSDEKVLVIADQDNHYRSGEWLFDLDDYLRNQDVVEWYFLHDVRTYSSEKVGEKTIEVIYYEGVPVEEVNEE